MELREVRRDPGESLRVKGTGNTTGVRVSIGGQSHWKGWVFHGQRSLCRWNHHSNHCEGGGPGQHEGAVRPLGHYKVKDHHRGMGCVGQGLSVGSRASYRVTWDPYSTRLTLWETQMGEGSPSV